MQAHGNSNNQAGRDINFISDTESANTDRSSDNDLRSGPNIMRLQALQIALLIIITILCAVQLTKGNLLIRDLEKIDYTTDRTKTILEAVQRDL